METIDMVIQNASSREYVVVDKKSGLVIVFDREANEKHGEERIKRIYRIVDKETNLVERFDVNGAIKELVDLLTSKVDVRKMLEGVLKTSPPEDIVKALERIKKKKAKVDIGDGCYSIMIHGGRGETPIEFVVKSG